MRNLNRSKIWSIFKNQDSHWFSLIKHKCPNHKWHRPQPISYKGFTVFHQSEILLGCSDNKTKDVSPAI